MSAVASGDNPFADKDGARQDLWSVGHRNPLSAAIDPAERPEDPENKESFASEVSAGFRTIGQDRRLRLLVLLCCANADSTSRDRSPLGSTSGALAAPRRAVQKWMRSWQGPSQAFRQGGRSNARTPPPPEWA